jgi:2-polyprenyl-3-methyl-5-hydroxy-6-metoxy-1,4-benzoquinol methylase
MLPRMLEPEVMDTASEAEDYNAMDHTQVNRVFADDLLAELARLTFPLAQTLQVFDAGTGTALIPIELAGRGLPVQITAADLAEEMLKVARVNVSRAGMDAKIRLVCSDCKSLADAFAAFDVVMSNSIVHHIPEPISVLRECWRVVRPGGLLFVRDLMRPESEAQLESLVATYAGTANAHARQMFRDSLHAALTVAEVQQLAQEIGLPPECVRATSDRHWTLSASSC